MKKKYNIIVADSGEELVKEGMCCVKSDKPEDVVVMQDIFGGLEDACQSRMYVNRKKATAFDLLHLMITDMALDVEDKTEGEIVEETNHLINEWKRVVKENELSLAL